LNPFKVTTKNSKKKSYSFQYLAQPTKQPIQISFHFHSTVFGPLGLKCSATLFFFLQLAEVGTAATAISQPRAAAMDASSCFLRKGNDVALPPLPFPSSNWRLDISPPLTRSYGAPLVTGPAPIDPLPPRTSPYIKVPRKHPSLAAPESHIFSVTSRNSHFGM
jgi:hypothetical protein